MFFTAFFYVQEFVFSAHTFSVGENKVTIERTVRGVEGLEPDESVKFFAGCVPTQLLELLLQIVFVGRKWLAKGMPKLQHVLMSVAVLVALIAIIISEDKNYVEQKPGIGCFLNTYLL